MSAVGMTRHVRFIQALISFLLIASIAGLPVAPSHMVVGASVGLFVVTYELVVRLSGASFTAGEGLLLSSLVALLATDAVFATGTKFPSVQVASQFSRVDRGPIYLCFLGLSLGIILCGVLLSPLMLAIVRRTRPSLYGQRASSSPYAKTAMHHAQRRKSTSTNARDLSTITFCFYLGFASIVGVPLRWWLGSMLGMDPFVWTAEFVVFHPTRLMLSGYWAMFVVLFIVALQLPSFAAHVARTRNIIVRKYFHALAVLMFVPGYILDPDFTRLAMGVALAGFVFVEFLRSARVPPFGISLNSFLSQYADARDAGPFILTHTYLLLGCAIPMWMEGVVGESSSLLPSAGLAGVLTLGVGDALASVVGTAYGRTRWRGTSKSIEGSLASLVGQLLVAVVVCSAHPACGIGLRERGPLRAVGEGFALLCGCVLEAVTDQIDNIVLPVYVFSLSCLI
eukprot:Opistho-2@30664